MQPTTSRTVPVVTCDGKGVVSHAGTVLLAELADRIGLTAALSEATAGLRGRRAGHDAGSRSGDDLPVGLGQPGRRRISGVQEAGRRLQSVRLGPLVNEVDLDVLRRRDRSQRRPCVGEPAVAGTKRRVPPATPGGVNVSDGRSG